MREDNGNEKRGKKRVHRLTNKRRGKKIELKEEWGICVYTD
jgi:hypothetical protein